MSTVRLTFSSWFMREISSEFVSLVRSFEGIFRPFSIAYSRPANTQPSKFLTFCETLATMSAAHYNSHLQSSNMTHLINTSLSGQGETYSSKKRGGRASAIHQPSAETEPEPWPARHRPSYFLLTLPFQASSR